jgi:hypothetical protein
MVFCRPPMFRKSGGKTVNVTYTIKNPAKSQPISRPKSQRLWSPDWFLYRNNVQTMSPVFSSTSKGGKGVKMVRQPSSLPNFATVNFFLWGFRGGSRTEQAGLSLIQESFQKSWRHLDCPPGQLCRRLWRWMERCKKYVRIGGEMSKNNSK